MQFCFKFSLFLTAIFYGPFARACDLQSPSGLNQLMQTGSSAFDASKQALAKDIRGTCKESSKEFYPTLLQDGFGSGASNENKVLEGDEGACSKQFPWTLSIAPAEAPRKYAYDRMDLYTDENDAHISGPANVEAFLSKSEKRSTRVESLDANTIHATPLTVNTSANISAKIKSMSNTLYVRANFSEAVQLKSSWGFWAAGASTDITHASSIGKGLQKIDQWMAVGDISLPSVFSEVLGNPKYEEGLRKAALKIMKSVDSGKPSQSHLMDDLKNSFMESGLSEKTATDYTWNVLGLIATAGPNLKLRLEKDVFAKGSPVSRIALSAIAIAAPVLDYRSFNGPAPGNVHPYSYPKEITTSCDIGKSYHFWMSAYFAHRLAKEHVDPTAAQESAFIADKAYQFTAQTGYRDPARILATNPLGAENNMIRADLTYSAAGATFGVQDATDTPKTQLNVDKAFGNVLEHSSYVAAKSHSGKFNAYAGQ